MAIISTFAALIAVSAFIQVPIGAVSFTLQTLFVILAGLILKPQDAFLSVLIYLTVGLIGIPVFTTGGGPQAFVSYTGGFLIGFLFVSIGISIFKSRNKNLLIDIPVILLFGLVVLYLFGITVYSSVAHTSIIASITAFVPYYVWDIVKIVLAYCVYYVIPDDVVNKFFKY